MVVRDRLGSKMKFKEKEKGVSNFPKNLLHYNFVELKVVKKKKRLIKDKKALV